MSADFENLKEKILNLLLDIVIFDGWSDKTLFEAASINEITVCTCKRMFPKAQKI